MRHMPTWAWGIAIAGLGAVVAGGLFPDTYVQDVLLQLGTAALILVPVLLVERSIGRRLTKYVDNMAVIGRSDAALHRDDMYRDFGQKLGARWSDQDRSALESRLSAEGWVSRARVDGYRIWERETVKLAMPDSPMVPGPIVRLVVRVAGWTDEDFSSPIAE